MAPKTMRKATAKTAAKKVLKKSSPPAKPPVLQPQATAVKKKAEVQVNGFKFEAAPSGFQKELLTDSHFKRFHGSRMLFSWLPQEFVDNNKDRFGYLFPRLAHGRSALPYTPAIKDLLQRLGDEIGNKDTAALPDGLPDGVIPSGYTYWGQFIDHDITLDVNSDINRLQQAHDIPNMRSPSLDLDAIYGQGPGLHPFLYDHNPALGKAAGVRLLVGSNQDTGEGGPALSSGTNQFGNPATLPGGNHFDVQRTTDFTAVIGDPRNDENLIVSQLHLAFIKFHNAVVDQLNTPDFTGDLFTEAKKVVTHHYQWAVIHDFLKKVADPQIVDRTLRHGPQFFRSKELFMPVEFSVAAYRFGHSMVRNDYFINAPLTGQLGNKPATMRQVFEFIRVPRLPLTSNWVVDFNLFFPGRPLPTANGVQFNHARRIDTRLALELERIPGASDSFMGMLAKRNLVRGLALGLPSGQAVARALGTPALTPEQLQSGNTPVENSLLEESGRLFLKQTPLWYYILKEAEVQQNGNRLGVVGSTILAETFVRLIREDINSFLHASPRFRPSLPRFNEQPPGDYTITDILHLAGVLTLD